MQRQYLLVFMCMIALRFAGAGEVTYAGSFPSTINCTIVNSFKSIVDSNKKIISLLEKKISESKSEKDLQKLQQFLADAQQRLVNSMETYTVEYNKYQTLNFYFEGEGSYTISSPKKESFEHLTLQNYELVNLCPAFIIENDDGTLNTRIPGACTVSVNLSSGYLCGHPYNKGSDHLYEEVLQKIADDFFVNSTTEN